MAKLLIMKMGTLLLTKEHGKTLEHENGNTLINQRTWQNSQLRKWGGGEKSYLR